MATKAKPVLPCIKTSAVRLYLFHVMLALFLLFCRCKRVSRKKSTRFVFSLLLKQRAVFLFCSRVVYSDGHDKPFRTKAITIIDNFKKALGDTDNR